MQLTFIGTRDEIDARTRRHRMHTSLLVSYRSANVMIDCGLDWLGKLKRFSPSAIVLTHAHPDHAWGLKQRRALSGVCAGKNVAGIAALPDQGSPRDQRAYADENLWDHIRSVPGRIFHSFADGRISRERRTRVHFLRARPHLHSRAQCSAERRANLHRRWRHDNALLYSQTRQSVNRSLACSDATDIVRERRRAARNHHALRI